jgi:hypothetical protein
METGPWITTECGVFAGIQTARSGGTTPNTVLRAHGHYAAGSKNQLILGMEMLGDHMRALKIVRQRGELRRLAAPAIQQKALALLRHLLST